MFLCILRCSYSYSIGVIKERQAEIDTMLADAAAPVEAGGKGEGEGKKEGEMDISHEEVSVVAGGSVREGGAHREGKRSEGEASDSD